MFDTFFNEVGLIQGWAVLLVIAGIILYFSWDVFVQYVVNRKLMALDHDHDPMTFRSTDVVVTAPYIYHALDVVDGEVEINSNIEAYVNAYKLLRDAAKVHADVLSSGGLRVIGQHQMYEIGGAEVMLWCLAHRSSVNEFGECLYPYMFALKRGKFGFRRMVLNRVRQECQLDKGAVLTESSDEKVSV